MKVLLEEEKIEDTVKKIGKSAFTVLDFVRVFRKTYYADWTRLVERFGKYGEKRRYTVTPTFPIV